MGLLERLFKSKDRQTEHLQSKAEAASAVVRNRDADEAPQVPEAHTRQRQLAYGSVGETTKKVKCLLDRVTALGECNSVEITEVSSLIVDIDSEFAELDDVFVAAARTLLLQIADDGLVTADERQLLSNFSKKYANPISDAPVVNVQGKAFVLTGDFETAGGKDTVAKMIEAAGGEIKTGTSRKVSFVVVGGLGSEAWAYGTFGQKIKKALDLKLTGKADIEIVTEKALMSYFSSSSRKAMDVFSKQTDRFERQWQSAKVVSNNFSGLTVGQQEVFDLVKSGRNVYLTGLGGTGKSFILNRIIKWAKDNNKNVIVCAPTGIAALNIGGCTVHRALGIYPGATLKPNPYPYIPNDSPLPQCDLMIVDEISMCRMDLFDYLSTVLKKAAFERNAQGKKLCQLVVVGDFCQLPPVVPKGEKVVLDQLYGYDVGNAYSFMGKEWHTWDFKKVELTEAIRQRDSKFVAALNACRVGDTNGLHWIENHAAARPAKNAITLCGRNDEAALINKSKLDAIPSEEWRYSAELTGEVDSGDMPTSKTLQLKVGARVMALANETISSYMNGSLGHVTQCNKDSVTVLFENGYEGVLYYHKWDITRPTLKGGKAELETIGTFCQIPLKLAYAMTIHKAQGQTFDSASIYPDCWDPGQLYTALSRLTSIDGLHLAHKCPDSSLITSSEVIAFNEGRFPARMPLIANNVGAQNKGSSKPSTSDVAAAVGDEGKDIVEEVVEEVERPKQPHSWTSEEEQFILANPSMTIRELANHFGVTPKAAERKRSKLRKAQQEGK